MAELFENVARDVFRQPAVGVGMKGLAFPALSKNDRNQRRVRNLLDYGPVGQIREQTGVVAQGSRGVPEMVD